MRSRLDKLYRQAQMDSAPAGRQIEISILDMASSKLRGQLPDVAGEEVKWSRHLDEALKFNQKVWDVFSADWMRPDSQLSTELRQNLLSIAVFVKKKTFTVMASPNREGISLLIQLNENIIDGLKAGLTQEQDKDSGSEAPDSPDEPPQP